MGTLILPPEWAPQSFVLLAWPHPEGDFAPWLQEVEHTYALITAAISRRQKVLIGCRDPAHRQRIKSRLNEPHPIAQNIRFLILPYHDTWVRDTAPLAVWEISGETHDTACEADQQWLTRVRPKLVDFRFNGWGGKYPSREDDALGGHLFRQGIFGSVPHTRLDWVLEGGSLETDGCGTLLATRSSIQNRNRNPDPGQAEVILGEALGLRRFLWLDHGMLEGDDTDGHIDTLARFCDCNTIIYQACTDTTDPHYKPLRDMAGQLSRFRNPRDEPYRLLSLPLPRPIHDATGKRLPASYANFLLINQTVLAPQYDDPADAAAVSCLSRAFPQREIVPIPARSLIRQYGSIHCLSMHYPLPLPLLPESEMTDEYQPDNRYTAQQV